MSVHRLALRACFELFTGRSVHISKRRDVAESSAAPMKLMAAAAGLAITLGAVPAGAVTITTTGIAVGSVGSNTQVGTLEDRPIGDDAIKYFIPLKDNNGTYGVGSACGGAGFGTCSDSGDGGGILTMVLRFSFLPLVTSGDRTLTVLFEDLDLRGANDPSGFLEKVDVRRSNGSSLTGGWITDIGGLVTGNSNTQQILNLVLAGLTDDPLYLLLKFKSISQFNGTNTPEYLIAMVSGECANCAPPPPEVPLPGAAALMATVLFGAGGIAQWRKRRTRRQA